MDNDPFRYHQDLFWDTYRSPYQEHGLSDTTMAHWPRPWSMNPPAGSWRLFMCLCPARNGVTECTPEALVDLLRGMVDTGQLEPDDVVQDVVLINGRFAVRGWRRAKETEER